MPDAVSRIAWNGSTAHIWTRRLDGTQGSPRAWMPESLVRTPAFADGPRLVATVRGVEGQVWRDGALTASQWWPEPPALESWRRFLRSAGTSPDADAGVPQPQSVPWGRPWADLQGAGGDSGRLERLAWLTVLGGIAFALGWQVSAYQRGKAAMDSLQQRMDEARGRARPLIEARERADAAATQLARLRTLQLPTSDYVMMAEMFVRLPKDARLMAWQRQDDKLGVSVLSAEEDPRVFVDAFAGHTRLSRVHASPGAPGTMQLAFELGPAPVRKAAE